MQLPIREILRSGTIVTKDKRYLRIIEVKPGPFLLSTPEEQNSIIANFASMLKIGPANIQIISMTLPADLTDQIRAIEKHITEEKNPSVKAMGIDFKDNLKEEQARSVSRRFFIVMQHERGSSLLHKVTIDEIEHGLNEMESTIINGLLACGNEVVDVDYNNRYQHVLEILYSMLNRDKSGTENFENHIQNVLYRYYHHFGDTEYYIPPEEYFAPDSMMFLTYDKIKINNLYYTYLYIPSNGYPGSVFSGWLTPFLNVTPGIDITIHLRRIPPEMIMGKLKRNIIFSGTSASESAEISSAYEQAVDTIQSGWYLKNGMSAGQDFYYMNTLITISASSPEILEKKVQTMMRLATEKEVKLVEATFEEEQAFISSLPLNYIDPSIYEKSKQNMLTIDAAATYPLTTSEYNEEGGIFLGTDLTNRSLVVLNPFSPRLTNPNFFVCGTSGAGKTFSILLMAMRMRMIHIPVYIIAPEKEHEFRRVCKAMGGQFITIAMGSKTTINIMEIRKQENNELKMIDGQYDELSYLSEKVDSVKIFIKLLVKDISIEETQLVDDALYKTYAKFGITRDNNSLWADEEHTHYKKMPILSDLRETLKDVPHAERIYNILGILTQGSGKTFNGQTNVDLDSSFTVISTEFLKGDMMPLGIYLAFDFLLSKIKENRIQKKALIVDEFWKMNDAADQMLETAKTCRGYSCSLMLATQQMKDIMKVDNGIYGEGILNNCATKVLLRMEKKDTDNVQEILGLPDEEKETLIDAEQGNALIISGKTHITVHFDAYPTEYKLITTKGDDLKQILNEMKESEEESQNVDEDGYEIKDGMLVGTYSSDTSADVSEEYSGFKKNSNERMIRFTDEDLLSDEEEEELTFSLDDLVPTNSAGAQALEQLKVKAENDKKAKERLRQ